MRQTILLTLLVSMYMYVGAQTYTFDNDGGTGNNAWNNDQNWNPDGVPPNPLPSGATIVIAANCTQDVNVTIRNGAALIVDPNIMLTRDNSLIVQGTMTVNGAMMNNTSMSISSTGILMNNGTINASDNINNAGTIENNGSINVLSGELKNRPSGTLNNNGTGTITVSNGASLINQNQMTNAGMILNFGIFSTANDDGDVFTNTSTGMITNEGTINVIRTFENNGSITNKNAITIINTGGIFNNNSGGTITNTLGGTIQNNNIINNAGMLTNQGTLNAAAGIGDLFNNTGSLLNTLNVTIGNGTFLNDAAGSVSNNTGGSFTVSPNGFLVNDGVFNNNALVTNNNSVSNSGTFNNNSGGVLNNGNGAGDVFDNTGTLNNNAGATINNGSGATLNTISGTFVNNGTYTGNAPLPIELLYFKGKQLENAIALHWETVSEEENAFIFVERSRDGIHFQEIGQRKGAGTTQLPQQYNFTDIYPFFGINYYRLRQVDLNGKPTYFPVIAIEYGGKTNETAIQVFPTQTKDQLTVLLHAPTTQEATLLVIDVNGRLLQRQQLGIGITQDEVKVSELPQGQYFIMIEEGNHLKTARFVKI